MQELERIIESEADDNVWRQHITRYEFALPFLANKRVLDVACGTGYGTHFLARSGKVRVTGVDISEEAIAHAKSHYSCPGLEFRQGSALDIGDFTDIEAVNSLETIEHLEEPERFLKAVVGILPDNGTFIVSTPNRDGGNLSDKPHNPYHVREWNAEEFMALLRRYFGEVEFFDQFLYVGKGWFPGSRTLANLILRLAKPDVLPRLRKWEVTQPLDFSLPFVNLRPRYIVAVCRNPRKS